MFTHTGNAYKLWILNKWINKYKPVAHCIENVTMDKNNANVCLTR